MDAAKKKALVEQLADAKNFDTLYPADSRRWFVDMAIRAYEAQGLNDVQIETKTIDLIVKATTLVMAKRDFSIGVTASKAKVTLQRGRRVEILYGAMAAHPEFAEPANEDLLLWDARRRMRGVTRMDFFVNPNGQGYFRYPRTCPSNERWRVNVDAQAFWEPSPAPPNFQFPFPLKRPAGGADPNYVTAVGKIWTAKTKPCDGNLLDCGVTAGAVLMDSLLEAKNSTKLLKKLDARGPTNLAIHHVSLSKDDSFIGDPGAEGLFERGSVAVGDLQVGDHIYVFNHGLYKVFRPTGSWTGEHSLVYNGGDRNYRSKNGFQLGGHGKEGTVYKFYDDFLAELQTYLHRAFRIGAIFLKWKESGGTLFPGQVQTVNETVDFQGQTIALDLHEFSVSYRYRNFQKTPKKGEPQPTIPETGFVVAYAAAVKKFLILKARKLVDIDPPKWFVDAITFERKDAAAEFDPLGWAILYVDPTKPEPAPGQPPAPERYELFTTEGSALAFKKLTIDDLFASPFAKRDPKKEPIAMTRPRVSFTAAYKTFLSTNGAI